MSGMSGNQGPAVELRGVAKRFGSTTALHALDLTIRKGEFFRCSGPAAAARRPR